MSETATRTAASASSSSKLISASAVMAAGTLASRVLGFGRLMLLVVLFGNGTRQADMFTFANTVPNSMYILLAGGVLNTVLVPQIVRAITHDPDGGDAYTNRVMTAGLLLLGAITVALTLAAPLIIRLYTPHGWHTPARAAQFDSIVTLAYYCLPQVFFYGVHVLAGQVLNARGRFGPMMWAPIANNVISILVLVTFLLVFGVGDRVSAFTSDQELLLGLGSTLGIAAQAAVLVPFLRAAGYRFHPRLDFRGAGLGHTFSLAKWTLGFVLITQGALVVVYRLAGSATAGGTGAGLTVYTNAYAVWILPHSLITVSLATAMLPNASRLAAAGDLVGVRDETMRTMRLAVTALLPTAVALVALAQPVAQLAFGFGQGRTDAHLVAWALTALSLGLVPFTLQYVCLRAYYSLEDTRTTFFLQLAISGTHVVLALSVVALLDRASLVATGLALAYVGAYTLGVVVSFRVLARRLPGLSGTELGGHLLRLLLAAAPAGLAAYAVVRLVASWSDSRGSLILTLLVAGAVAVPAFLLLARLLHVDEVTDILATLSRRRPRSPGRTGLVEGSGDGDDPGSSGDSTLLMAETSPTIGSAQNAAPGRPDPGGPTETTDPMASQRGVSDRLDEPLSPTGDSLAGGPGSELETPTVRVQSVAATMPAGTLLAGRYRLEELLANSEPTVTWRAFDQVLSRSVLVHLLPPLDPGADDLLTAARRASVATDSRFLRVLDAVHSDRTDLGSYIVCEYATGQSLGLVLSRGPLSGLEAAWVVREVADALSGVHVHGLHHRRINPDTVIITPSGHVKIVGLMIEAALRPLQGLPVPGAATAQLVDVFDLGRLLYAALVGRWPGGPAYGLPDAPTVGRRWMSPRQVRAGVSPALDTVSDQILGEPPRHRAEPLRTANDVVNALTTVLGTADASADLERRLRQPVPRVDTPRAAPVSSLLDSGRAGVTRRVGNDEPGLSTQRMAPVDAPRRTPDAASAPPPAPLAPVPWPPQTLAAPAGAAQTLGAPIQPTHIPPAHTTPAHPTPAHSPSDTPPAHTPPADPELAEAQAAERDPAPAQRAAQLRPAPPAPAQQAGSVAPPANRGVGDPGPVEVSQTALIRQPPPPQGRPPHLRTSRTGSGHGSGDRAAGAVARARPRRPWRGVVVLMGALVLVAGLVSAVVLGARPTSDRADPPSAPTASASSPSASAAPTPLTVLDARDFDPQGHPSSENPQLVPKAIDGKPRTRWQTVTYYRNPKLGGLKRGVGLVLDLGEVKPVRRVTASLSGSGTHLELRVPKQDPAQADSPPMSSDHRWRRVSHDDKAGHKASFELTEPVSTRFLLVYLTSLPKEGSGYRGGIYEVHVFS